MGLLCGIAIVVGLWSAGVVCQGAPTVVPEVLRAHLKGERLDVVTSIRGLPLTVRNELGKLFGTYLLDIAEPGAAFQSTGVNGDPKLPIRRLVLAGCSIDHCFVYYERGGTPPTWRATLYHWTPEATRFEAGGTAASGLGTIEDVRNAMLSGAITNPNGLW